MSFTANYNYCNGPVAEVTQVTVSTGTTGCVVYQAGWDSGPLAHPYYRVYRRTAVKAQIPLPITVPLTITIQESVDFDYGDRRGYTTSYRTYTMVIPSGSTSTTVYRDCFYSFADYAANSSGDFSARYSAYRYYDWKPLPNAPVNCTAQPPSCHLAITGVTVTNETLRGANNGQIRIGVSGNTGTTVAYQINSQYNVYTYSGNTNNHTFTGLQPTTYDIYVKNGLCHQERLQVEVLQGQYQSGNFDVTLPSLLSASENPMMVTLSTALSNVAATNTIVKFDVSGTVNNNDSITFNLQYPQIYLSTYYAKGFPNQQNYFLATTLTNAQGANLGTNTPEDIAVSLAEAWQKDAVLPRIYYINNSGSTVYLIAKDRTVNTNLTSSNVLITGTGIVMTVLQNGSDFYQGSVVNNYGLYTEVYLNAGMQFGETPNMNNFNRVAELYLPYNQSNIMQFKVDEILKNYVSTPKIDFTFTGHSTQSSMLAAYYVNYGESYPLVINTNTSKKKQKSSGATVQYVINSALAWTSANDMSSYWGNWNPTGGTNQTITGVTFLTNSPNPKLIQRNSEEFLYFLIPANYPHATELRGDIYFYDGTSLINHKFFDIFTVPNNFGGVLALNVGYDKLGLQAIEVSGMTTRKIKQIDFAVHQLSGTTQYSVTKSFIYAVDDALRRFGIAFQNKLGGYDIFDFTGIVEQTLDRQAGTYSVPRAINSDGSSPLGFNARSTYNTLETKTVTVNSGWLNSSHYLWLKEMLASNKIFSYTEQDQPYLNITAFTYKKSSLEDLFDMEVTFSYTLNESNISI